MIQRKAILFFFVAILVLSSLPLNVTNAKAQGTTRQSLDIKKTLVQPIIDGKLEEEMWSVNEPIDVTFGKGEFKDSQFGMLWDHTYLYIGVTVEDDQLVHDGDGSWFQQDNISLFFDPSQHQSAPFAENDMQIGLVYGLDSSTPKFYFGAAANHKNKAENDILRAIEKTDKGWNAEVAIPWEMLDFDPELRKQLGFEINVTHRDDKTDAPFSAWSAYQSSSFWNDTSGYGTVNLSEETVTGTENHLLLEENFDSYETGEFPTNWTSHVNSGSQSFKIAKDAGSSDGKLVYDGSASGHSAAALAPVRWDNYIVEADLTFEQVLNSARWASVVVRASDNGLNQYNQMAVRQNGSFEFAYRTPNNAWSVPVAGKWTGPLALGEDYRLKIRIVDNNVKEYIKAKNDQNFTLLTDQRLDSSILERGKVGVRADQSKVAYDNFKVTRVTADDITMKVPSELESLTGPVAVSYEVAFSDGVKESVPTERVKLYSSDKSVIKIIDGQLYPFKEGKATVKAIYQNAIIEKEIHVTPSTEGVKVMSLAHEDGYILGTEDIAIAINGITFQTSNNDLTEGQITGDQVTWSSESAHLEIGTDSILPKRAGVYSLTVTKDGGTMPILLVVKGAEDDDYVLYEESFNEGTNIPENWTKLSGTTDDEVSVKEGALEINGRGDNSNGTGVLLPEYLGLFGNYKIEADMTHLDANNTGRWNSIMYRVQNNSYPYYQMAVRQNATAANGVEFAERTPANAWNVPEKAGYRENISKDKMYRYTVVAYGNRVQEWINDDLLIDTDLATSYEKGRIGFQSTGSLTKVDNIKVTLQTEELPKLVRPGENFVTVAEPDTSISLAPSVVKEVGSSEDYNSLMKGDLPATAILHVNNDLEVTDEAGKVIASLSSAIEKLNEKVIPAFAIKDEATIEPLTQFLMKIKLEDAFVLSNQPQLVKKAREAYPIIRGIIEYPDASNLSEDQLMDIRRTTNSHLAKIILLPEGAASRGNVEYLQKKLMTVWVKEDRGATNVDFHRIITAGPNGIVTGQHEVAIDALEFYSDNTTLVRTPYMLAHRGIPGLAPENTLEGAILAYEKGADHIENDIYLTKDGHIVILHDGTLDRTTNGTGYIENYTLSELKQLLANNQFPVEYPNARIPTLREFFKEFKGKEVEHIVEIKSGNPAIVDELIKLIKEMDVENQVSVISFNADQLQLLAEKMPGISIGFLTSGIANETNVNPSLRATLSVVQNLNSTFNTSYSGLGENFMEAAKHRGVTFWPWTFRNQDLFVNYLLLGTNGLTTDYNHWAADWASSITPTQTEYHLTARRSVELTAQIETYDREVKDIKPEIVFIDGQDHVTVEGNVVTAQSGGTVQAMLRYTQELPGGKSYDIYTQPIKIEVVGKSNAKDNQIVIDQENAEVEIEKIPRLKEGILVTTSASIKGEGLKNNVVIISPIKEDTIVNLNGERVQQVIIDNSNIKEIRGAENVRKWIVQDGVDVTELKVYSSSGEEVGI